MHLPQASSDDGDAIARDIAAINRIGAVPSLLRVICDFTGMGFAAVARVTDENWTACAVLDAIGFGLQPGDHLDLETTVCFESRAAREAIAFDHASEDPIYRDHHTPRIYRIESYISVPIVRKDGTYFGNLCAIDRKPRRVSDERTLTMFKLFADLIALQLESEDRQQAAESACRANARPPSCVSNSLPSWAMTSAAPYLRLECQGTCCFAGKSSRNWS
jgi:GAF domain-containing protein